MLSATVEVNPKDSADREGVCAMLEEASRPRGFAAVVVRTTGLVWLPSQRQVLAKLHGQSIDQLVQGVDPHR